MAITKIWTVKSRLDSSLNYIVNPEKTSIKPDIDAVEGVIKYIKNEDKTENCLYAMNYSQVSRHKKAHFFRGAGYLVCSQYKASASFGVSILSVPCGLFVL